MVVKLIRILGRQLVRIGGGCKWPMIVLNCIALEVMNKQIVPWPICLSNVVHYANVW
jgi:hypothetical protein